MGNLKKLEKLKNLYNINTSLTNLDKQRSNENNGE